MKEYQTELVKNLPDVYRKDPDSNNYKFFQIESEAVERTRATLEEIRNILFFENATGKTLDLYGERVGQPRGQAKDDKYLVMIKAKILRNLSNGSYPSVLNAICKTFDCDPSLVKIKEIEPCVVELETMPFEVINKAGFTTSQAFSIIKSLLPVGVTLANFMFEGTFEFGENEDELDETKGFSDVGAFPEDENYDEVIGGYLGASIGDENDAELPI